MGPFHLKNQDGVDFRYFRKRPILKIFYLNLEQSIIVQLPIFILIRFWEIREFLTNRLRESPCYCCKKKGKA
jgi:hypothetical protein